MCVRHRKIFHESFDCILIFQASHLDENNNGWHVSRINLHHSELIITRNINKRLMANKSDICINNLSFNF
ncbi:hypothetical protein T03_13947 [Trichinella britovi]|uniref:Uncharacterized protein n=1 Tax=Trichinella britovi TaxID=45882 RepID=A0A0V1CE02_TRIBR|nr:hypothetical protein T09_1045 [Trichinella sp. T9]KRY47567.1 hypothetical protein T03_13947 [Trichinella britovi]